MTVAFRNVAIDVAAPLESWPYEAIVAAIERGLIGDWARISAAVRRDPWGPVSRQVEDYLSYERPYGVAPLLERVVVSARTDAERREREAVAATVRDLVAASGLSMEAFASRLGTSRSRLSTYRSGSVTPSAALVVRMRKVVRHVAPQTGDLPQLP
jgi:DNA-binding transcriptional regulator YiaG